MTRQAVRLAVLCFGLGTLGSAAGAEEHRFTAAEWEKKIRLWRSWIFTPDGADGVRNITEISDAWASLPLVRALSKEEHASVRRVYLFPLARIADQRSLWALMAHSTDDDDEKVRATAVQLVQRLSDEKQDEIAAMYVTALSAKQSVVAERAAKILVDLRREASIGPLIDELNITQRWKVRVIVIVIVVPYNFAYYGGSYMEKFKKPVQNGNARSVLVQLTGVDYGFDEGAWRRWHRWWTAQQRTARGRA